MNEITAYSRRRSIHRIAGELCELYQQQIDTLQHDTLAGLPEGELEQYSERQERLAGIVINAGSISLRAFVREDWEMDVDA